MPKRKLELDREVIDYTLEILAEIIHASHQIEEIAKERGKKIPKKFEKKIGKVLIAHMMLSKANREVEIAELEEMFNRE